MQELKIYVSASGVVASIRDYANARSESAPSLVRGVETCLKLRLYAAANTTEPYPIEQLSGITAWKWAMDKDYNESTNYILQADNENITVGTVTEKVEDVTYTYTEVSIPIPQTNTEELVAWLGNDKSKTGLVGELVGYNGNGDAVFILQLENFSVRNRLTSTGSPTPIEPDYLTEAQVRAIIGETENTLSEI